MLVDLVLVSQLLTKYRRQFFNYADVLDRTLFLNSIDAARIAMSYHRFTYTGHPMIRTAIIELDSPKQGERYAQIFCVSGIASEVKKVLAPCDVPANVLREHVIYVMAAKAIRGTLPTTIPLVPRGRP